MTVHPIIRMKFIITTVIEIIDLSEGGPCPFENQNLDKTLFEILKYFAIILSLGMSNIYLSLLFVCYIHQSTTNLRVIMIALYIIEKRFGGMLNLKISLILIRIDHQWMDWEISHWNRDFPKNSARMYGQQISMLHIGNSSPIRLLSSVRTQIFTISKRLGTVRSWIIIYNQLDLTQMRLRNLQECISVSVGKLY